jgi:RNA polymerase sigma factor (sigma-70 family)
MPWFLRRMGRMTREKLFTRARRSNAPLRNWRLPTQNWLRGFGREIRMRWARSFGPITVHADAEEEVSDVFEWIWEHRTNWNVSATGIRAYLYRAVRNRVLNREREHRRAGMRYLRLAREGHEAIVPRTSPIITEQLIVTEAADAFVTALDAILKQMTPGVREVVSLRANVGLTFEEIAVMTDSTVAAVRKQWTRGLKFLREEFAHLLHDPRS